MPRYYLPNGKSVWNDQDVPDDKMEEFIALHMKDDETAPELPETESTEPDEIEQYIKSGGPPQPESPGYLSQAWSMASEPLLDFPSRMARSASENIFQPLRKNVENPYLAAGLGYLEGTTEGMGDAMSAMTSPINLLSLGAGSKFKGLHNIGRLASGLTTAHGIGEVAGPDKTWQERAWGAVETAGGIAGMKAKLGKVAKQAISPEATPPIDLAPTPTKFPEGALKRRYDQLMAKEQTGDLKPKDLAEARQLNKLLRNADVEPINPDTGQLLNPPVAPESGKMMAEVPDNPEMAGYDPYRRTTGKGPEAIPIEEPPTATFAGMQDDGDGGQFAIFHVKGGIKDKSTVSAKGLGELGIEVPPTPETIQPEVLPIEAGIEVAPEPTLPTQIPRGVDPNAFAKLTPEEQGLIANELNKSSTPQNLINDGADVIDQATGEVIDTTVVPEPIVSPEIIPEAVPKSEMVAAAPPPIKPPPPPANIMPDPIPPGGKKPRKPREPRGPVPEIVMNPDGTFSPKGTKAKFDKSGNQVAGPPVSPEQINYWKEAFSFPRAIMASIDLPPFRQGLPMITNKAFWTSWDEMAKSYGSQVAHDLSQDILMYGNNPTFVDGVKQKSPKYLLAEQGGVKFTDQISKTEEAFSSHIAGKFPGVTRSHRAHIAFLNQLRFDSFHSLVKDQHLAANQPGLKSIWGDSTGLDPMTNEVVLKQLGEFVNDTTGRGSLDIKPRFEGTRAEFPGLKLDKYADLFNAGLFSTRLMTSRVRMFNRYFNPHTWMMMPPTIRKETLKSLAGVVGTWTVAAGLMSQIPGAEVSMDPTSTDFGKIRIGNFRMDPGAGFQQYLVAFASIASGLKTRENKRIETGSSFGAPTRGSIAGNFIGNKLNPPVAFLLDLFNASKEQPFAIGDKTIKMVMPIILQDLIEILKEDPKLIPMLIPAAVGMGTQIYGEGETGKIIPKSWDYSFEGGSMFR